MNKKAAKSGFFLLMESFIKYNRKFMITVKSGTKTGIRVKHSLDN